MLTIPLPQGSAFYSQRVELEGTTYVLEFSWNARGQLGAGGCWFLSVLNQDDVVLVAGLAVVSNRPLLRRFHWIEGMPPGDLFAADLTETIPYAQYDQLGTDVRLVYFTAAEMAE